MNQPTMRWDFLAIALQNIFFLLKQQTFGHKYNSENKIIKKNFAYLLALIKKTKFVDDFFFFDILPPVVDMFK